MGTEFLFGGMETFGREIVELVAQCCECNVSELCI